MPVIDFFVCFIEPFCPKIHPSSNRQKLPSSAQHETPLWTKSTPLERSETPPPKAPLTTKNFSFK